MEVSRPYGWEEEDEDVLEFPKKGRWTGYVSDIFVAGRMER